MPRLMAPLVLLMALLGLCSCAFDPTTYPNSLLIMPRYTAYWRVDQPNGQLYLALKVQTTGWVGFGIAELASGSMPGSDIVTVGLSNGVPYIQDRYATAFALPSIDSCQDWKLISAVEENGFTTVELQRALDTKDSQDRAIVPGPNRIVVAFGENFVDTVSYHTANRITGAISFYGDEGLPTLPLNAQFVDLRMSDFVVPNVMTHYTCQAFPLPIDQPYHVVRIDPLINSTNVLHVHHFLAHICANTTSGYVGKYYNKPGKCSSPIGATGSGCDSLMAGWAAGGGPTVLPAQAGFPMGPDSNSAKFMVLELHYNNPDGIGGYADNSGIRIWYTTTIRENNAGMITLGDPGVTLPDLPGNAMTHYETECPSFCTSRIPAPINVFQTFPHMHQVGSQIWTSHWRNDTQLEDIGRVDFWSFDHQQQLFVNYTINPGDRLNTHCIWNTLGKGPVAMGSASTDEMCMLFISYWPRIITSTGALFPYCGYAGGVTGCGQYTGAASLVQYANPTVRDPAGGQTISFGLNSTMGTCTAPPALSTTSTNGSEAAAAPVYLLSFVLLTVLYVIVL